MYKGLTIKDLEECFVNAKENNATWIAVAVKNEDSESSELIINPNVNFDDKLAYYKKAYNNDLTLKSYSKIYIAGFTYGDSLSEIEEYLFEDED